MSDLAPDFVERFWKKDTTLWSGGKYGDFIPSFMGWLDVVDEMIAAIPEIEAFAAEVKAAGFTRAILAGMGGSSLAPLVFTELLATPEGLPVAVLDSTDPATVKRIEDIGPMETTLVIVSSKSGGTAEPNAFNDYLYAQTQLVKGDKAGENFVAITDPGSPFEARAKSLNFRKIFLNRADIGGRYSALSYFGLVPAAIAGIDLNQLMAEAKRVLTQNGPSAKIDGSDSDAGAFGLGRWLGLHALEGRNKVTFLLPDELAVVGLWMEQLIAESTGKEGKGILPVAIEEPGTVEAYGKDRVFAFIYEAAKPPEKLLALEAALGKAGHPTALLEMPNRFDIAGQMLGWEIATATVGAVIDINPFDQPNVQESKDVTKEYVAKMEAEGSLPAETSDATDGGLQIFGVKCATVAEGLTSFLDDCIAGDYVCLQNYLTESEPLTAALRELQAAIRDRKGVAVTNGYGPRFLHSTGQFHKGGPNTGHFIQLLQKDSVDVPLPGKNYTFGAFRNAQALGDKVTLQKHDRRVISIELGSDTLSAVKKLIQVVRSA